jgi:Tfp pilus assembly protein PilF
MRLYIVLFLLLSSSAFAAEEAVPVTEAQTVQPRPLPPRSDSGLVKAEGQLAEGKYMQAIQTLSGVLTRHPSSADALAYIAAAWGALGDDAKAQVFIDRALKYDPTHLGANKVRAEVYLNAGDFQRALEQLQVIRMICGDTDCAEMDELQAEMNRFKKGERPAPPVKKEEEKPAASSDGNR